METNHRKKTTSEKNEKNNREQKRHQHHTRISTHGRHRRRRSSHGLRLVNGTTQQPTRAEPGTQGEPELRFFRLPDHQYDGLRQKLRFSSCFSSNVLREG